MWTDPGHLSAEVFVWALHLLEKERQLLSYFESFDVMLIITLVDSEISRESGVSCIYLHEGWNPDRNSRAVAYPLSQFSQQHVAMLMGEGTSCIKADLWLQPAHSIVLRSILAFLGNSSSHYHHRAATESFHLSNTTVSWVIVFSNGATAATFDLLFSFVTLPNKTYKYVYIPSQNPPKVS